MISDGTSLWYSIIMPKKEKPLPKPPSTPFGKKRPFENEKQEQLIADEMAAAMAEGKIDEFLKNNMPDNEHARKLAEMMMGMTGMMPESFTGSPSSGKEGPSDEKSPEVKPAEDIVNAVQAGDLQGIMGLLAKEHARRTGSSITEVTHEAEKSVTPSSAEPAVDREIIDQLIKIASDNNISLDWLFFRALKRYVEEYKKTGNL